MRALAIVVAVVIAAAIVAGSTSARADDGLRCGEWLVTVGAGKPEVAAKCGAPTHVETKQHVSRTRYGTRRCVVELWTYDRGPSEFVRTLAFENDLLVDVGVGDYGAR